MKDVFLTPSAAARLIGKSEGSVRIYAATGKLPCIRTSTGVRLFRQSDCEEFARKRGKKNFLGKILESEIGSVIVTPERKD